MLAIRVGCATRVLVKSSQIPPTTRYHGKIEACWMACSQRNTNNHLFSRPLHNTHILERSPQLVPKNLSSLILHFFSNLTRPSSCLGRLIIYSLKPQSAPLSHRRSRASTSSPSYLYLGESAPWLRSWPTERTYQNLVPEAFSLSGLPTLIGCRYPSCASIITLLCF